MNVTIPNGYQLRSEGVDDHHIYSFEAPDGTKCNEWWAWKLGAIDAMWIDVRARAVKAALPPNDRSLRNNSSYALGYVSGKAFVDNEVRIKMAQAGYAFKPEITAIETVEKLLIMLNQAHPVPKD